MKLLIIDVNFDYKNIMYRQFYTNLTLEFDVCFFGPGYVDRDTLKKGINSFIDVNGPFDSLLLGTYFVYSAMADKEDRQNAYFVHRNVIPYYKVSDAYFNCAKLFYEVRNLNNIDTKILLYYEDNCYMSYKEKVICQDFMEADWYLLTWPREMMHYFEPSTIQKHSVLTNNCIELYDDMNERIIPISLQAISSHELFYRCYYDREYDWCVPGNRNPQVYPQRQIIYNTIRAKGLKIWSKDPYQNVSVNTIEKNNIFNYDFRNSKDRRYSRHFGKDIFVRSAPTADIIGATREVYLESLRKTKCIYADGSITNTLLRKHFETCACGGLLVTASVDGLSAMGFVDGVNCRVIDDNFDELIADVSCDEHNEKIAKQGQKLIIEKHMFCNRVRSLKETIDKIKSGTYRGAYWEYGTMLFH